ncbi:MAG: hypothetical protein FJZ11_05280, partial [Candidatus Omnitrophica bacterium]|nr:hypothetical protein [Candidatus Omnitrophota bacterium]
QKCIEAIKRGKYQKKAVVYLPSDIPIILVGDLHARLDNLKAILAKDDNLGKIQRGEAILVILGDAVHPDPLGGLSLENVDLYLMLEANGEMDSSVEIIRFIMDLKIQNPDNVYYLQGNHDTLDQVYRWRKDQGKLFREKLEGLFGEGYLELYKQFISLSPLLAIGQGIVVIHAGPIKKSFDSLSEIEEVDTLDWRNPIVLQALWGRWQDRDEHGRTVQYYDENDVAAFLSAIAQPEAILVVGHSPHLIPKGEFFRELIREKHCVLFAARYETGYGLFKDGKIEFIPVKTNALPAAFIHSAAGLFITGLGLSAQPAWAGHLGVGIFAAFVILLFACEIIQLFKIDKNKILTFLHNLLRRHKTEILSIIAFVVLMKLSPIFNLAAGSVLLGIGFCAVLNGEAGNRKSKPSFGPYKNWASVERATRHLIRSGKIDTVAFVVDNDMQDAILIDQNDIERNLINLRLEKETIEISNSLILSGFSIFIGQAKQSWIQCKVTPIAAPKPKKTRDAKKDLPESRVDDNWAAAQKTAVEFWHYKKFGLEKLELEVHWTDPKTKKEYHKSFEYGRGKHFNQGVIIPVRNFLTNVEAELKKIGCDIQGLNQFEIRFVSSYPPYAVLECRKISRPKEIASAKPPAENGRTLAKSKEGDIEKVFLEKIRELKEAKEVVCNDWKEVRKLIYRILYLGNTLHYIVFPDDKGFSTANFTREGILAFLEPKEKSIRLKDKKNFKIRWVVDDKHHNVLYIEEISQGKIKKPATVEPSEGESVEVMIKELLPGEIVKLRTWGEVQKMISGLLKSEEFKNNRDFRVGIAGQLLHPVEKNLLEVLQREAQRLGIDDREGFLINRNKWFFVIHYPGLPDNFGKSTTPASFE